MLAEIGISAREAQRIMSIGQNRAISNRTNWSDFPGAMAALYELSRMDPDDIGHGIETGAITLLPHSYRHLPDQPHVVPADLYVNFVLVFCPS